MSPLQSYVSSLRQQNGPSCVIDLISDNARVFPQHHPKGLYATMKQSRCMELPNRWGSGGYIMAMDERASEPCGERLGYQFGQTETRQDDHDQRQQQASQPILLQTISKDVLPVLPTRNQDKASLPAQPKSPWSSVPIRGPKHTTQLFQNFHQSGHIRSQL
jgi:hypothetical protein